MRSMLVYCSLLEASSRGPIPAIVDCQFLPQPGAISISYTANRVRCAKILVTVFETAIPTKVEQRQCNGCKALDSLLVRSNATSTVRHGRRKAGFMVSKKFCSARMERVPLPTRLQGVLKYVNTEFGVYFVLWTMSESFFTLEQVFCRRRGPRTRNFCLFVCFPLALSLINTAKIGATTNHLIGARQGRPQESEPTEAETEQAEEAHRRVSQSLWNKRAQDHQTRKRLARSVKNIDVTTDQDEEAH
jgi:hypothetical protein